MTLPPGYSPDAPPVSSVVDGSEGTVMTFTGTSADPDQPRPHLGINVSRDRAIDTARDGDGVTRTAVKVHGVDAELLLFPHFKGTEGRSDSDFFTLTWTENGAHVSVFGTYGATRSDVEGLAAGLVVDPHGKGAATPAAERQIRAAFADAFTGRPTPDPARALSAIDHGGQLRVAYDQLVARLPDTASTATVVVQRITFSAPDRAQVQFRVAASFQGRPQSLDLIAEGATRVNGTWKVSQEAYCQVIRQLGINCP